MKISNSMQIIRQAQKAVSAPVEMINNKLEQDAKTVSKNVAITKMKLNSAKSKEIKEIWEKEKAGSAGTIAGSRSNSGKHGGLVNAGIYEAYTIVGKQIDSINTCKDYLDIAGMYEKMSKEEGITEETAQYYRDIVDNIKLYVSQEVGANSPIDLHFKSQNAGLPDYGFGSINVRTKGAVSNLILPLTGDYSREALGLEALTEDYKNYSVQELKDIFSEAESKLTSAMEKIGDLYTQKSGNAASYDSKYQNMTKSNFDEIYRTLSERLTSMGNANQNGLIDRNYGEIKLDQGMTKQQIEDWINDNQLKANEVNRFKDNLSS